MSLTTMTDPLDVTDLPPGICEVQIRASRYDEAGRPAAWQCWLYERNVSVARAVGIRVSPEAALRAALQDYARTLAGRPAGDPDIEDMLG